jgi:cytokinin riboside 5'-monophosphate phosphoribohydrolase
MASVCVFCSSSNLVQPAFVDVARRLGHELAMRGYRLVYGGGDVGLMGVLARSAHAANGKVVGILPRSLREGEGIAYEIADELIITDTMAERKTMLRDYSDAFIVLPGGLGTLEEFLEVLTLKQLGYHAKPIILINTAGIYDPLMRLFEHLHDERFLREQFFNLFHVAPDASEAIALLS